MTNKAIFESIELELRKARRKHPNWPDHAAAQAGIVCEEAGELMRACLQWKYERNPNEEQKQLQDIKEEAVQVAVTAIRFLQNLR